MFTKYIALATPAAMQTLRAKATRDELAALTRRAHRSPILARIYVGRLLARADRWDQVELVEVPAVPQTSVAL